MSKKLPPGLVYDKDVLTADESKKIVEFLDSKQWSHATSRIAAPVAPAAVKRRVLEYGSAYHTGAKGAPLPPIPDELRPLSERLAKKHLPAGEQFTQLIVNEYEPGQGIGAHTDDKKMFGDVICSVSLLSPCVMRFERSQRDVVNVLLEPLSCVALTGEGRTLWTHEIAKRKTDEYDGKKIQRGRRISLTFRQLSAGPRQTK